MLFSPDLKKTLYPTIMNLEKKNRESTDLEEYVLVVPKNIV